MSAPTYSWRMKLSDTRLHLQPHTYDSARHGPLTWWDGYAVGPDGMVSVYAQNDEDGSSYAQFRFVAQSREWSYRKAWANPISQRAVARAAGELLRTEVRRLTRGRP